MQVVSEVLKWIGALTVLYFVSWLLRIAAYIFIEWFNTPTHNRQEREQGWKVNAERIKRDQVG